MLNVSETTSENSERGELKWIQTILVGAVSEAHEYREEERGKTSLLLGNAV
jgi:hypothetical protein